MQCRVTRKESATKPHFEILYLCVEYVGQPNILITLKVGKEEVDGLLQTEYCLSSSKIQGIIFKRVGSMTSFLRSKIQNLSTFGQTEVFEGLRSQRISIFQTHFWKSRSWKIKVSLKPSKNSRWSCTPGFFISLSPGFFLGLWHKSSFLDTKKKTRFAGPEIFLKFEADLDYSRP